MSFTITQTTFQVNNAPSKQSMAIAMVEKNPVSLIYKDAGKISITKKAVVILTSMEREDGSFENWCWKGRTSNGRPCHGFINNRTKKGTISFV